MIEPCNCQTLSPVIRKFQQAMTDNSVEGLSGKLDSLALIPSHRIIVGVDYGTTFTGTSSTPAIVL
jgi:hypothetical protein